jgi:hypothetical protein
MKQKAAFQLEKHGARVVYRLSWAEVRRILGRDHANTAADDAKLARALRAAGARPLGKSYAKEDGWHAFAPKGTPTPALAKRRNPAEDEADPHPGDFRKPIERVDESISKPALAYMTAQRSAAQAAGKKHRAKPVSLRDLEWAHEYARRLHYSAEGAMEDADAGKKYKGPHDAAYFLGMMEGALAVEGAIAASVAPLRARSQERDSAAKAEPGLLSRLVDRVRGYASKPVKAGKRRPKARKRAKPSR